MTEGSASGVLAALGGSTYRTEYAFRLLACCGPAGPASAEAASRRRAGLFEHPASHLIGRNFWFLGHLLGKC